MKRLHLGSLVKKRKKPSEPCPPGKESSCFPPETLPFVCIEEPLSYCSLHLHIDILDIIRKAKDSSRLWWAPRDIVNMTAPFLEEVCKQQRRPALSCYQICICVTEGQDREDIMWLFRYERMWEWLCEGVSQRRASISHMEEGTCPLTTVLWVRPGRYVYSPFTISNPVWKPILNVKLLPKLARVFSDWLKYCNPALSDRPELCISAKSIR